MTRHRPSVVLDPRALAMVPALDEFGVLALARCAVELGGRPEPPLPAMTDDDRNALAEKTSSKTCREMLAAALRIRLESASEVRDVWRRAPCESLRLDYQELFY